MHIIGNLKFDITITHDLLQKIKLLKQKWQTKQRLIWIASSTHSGEEIILLNTYKKLLTIFPNLLMILAPRNLNRISEIIQIIKNFDFSYITKNSNKTPTKNTKIIINDTIGNMMLLYGISDIAFIGGSLIKHGGHNPLEPAAHAIPIIMGPHTFNFTDICSKLKKSNGLINISDSKSLINVMSKLLQNKKLRMYHGTCAEQVLRQNQGSSQKLLQLIKKYLVK